MAETRRVPRFDMVSAVVGVLVLLLAAVVAWDAMSLSLASAYGIGPKAMPYLIAGGLLILGCVHLVAAVRIPPAELEPADPVALVWMVGGLIVLIATIWLGGGFILATTLLFAATARAFGRRALVADLAIGVGLSLLVYLVFTRLLTLSLPEGPLERLLRF